MIATIDTLDPNRTIVAVSSPMAPAIRGIVRVSGPQTVACLNRICSASLLSSRLPERTEIELRIGGFSSPVPAALLLWPSQRSYTRQPSAEIHTMGSPPILDAIVRSLCESGATLARPGEFTLRAFLAGRIDLSQAEAILAAVDAANETEFATALAQSAGGLRQPLDRLRHDLLDLLAHLEAGLDFVDEDIQFISRAALNGGLRSNRDTVHLIQNRIGTRDVTSPAFRVTLVGPPNAGKSSLFNALLGRPAAIAAPSAGTTRDFLVESVHWNGFSIQLVDTAGVTTIAVDSNLHDSVDLPDNRERSIEVEAQLRTRQTVVESDLRIACQECGPACDSDWHKSVGLSDDRVVTVRTKADLGSAGVGPHEVAVSAVTGEGLGQLKDRICQRLEWLDRHRSACGLTSTRCAEPLSHASAALDRAVEILEEGGGDELIAAELREALEGLGRIVGAVYTDDILDRIFSRFCIGK